MVAFEPNASGLGTNAATLAQQWDHRPDLEFSQDTEACDPEVARRYKDSVPVE